MAVSHQLHQQPVDASAQVSMADNHVEDPVKFVPKLVQGDFVKPMNFEQKLLVCNAFSHEKPVQILVNEENDITKDKKLPYKRCEYLSTKVTENDRLDFNVEEGIGGTFEVSDLPKNDAVLLLVFERRDSSSNLASFQSFAFPFNSAGAAAQVAIIDTVKGLPGKLRMEDHVTDKKSRVRFEMLDFNRVYSIEAGNYDADLSHGDESTSTLKKTLSLNSGENYVLLRTGTPDEEDLVTFPSDSAFAASVVVAFLAMLI